MRRVVLLSALVCVLLGTGTAFGAALTESYATLLHQVDAGQVTIAYVNEETLLASVKVDGMEMTEKDQTTLSGMPLSLLMTVEVVTRTPREVAGAAADGRLCSVWREIKPCVRSLFSIEPLSRPRPVAAGRRGHGSSPWP